MRSMKGSQTAVAIHDAINSAPVRNSDVTIKELFEERASLSGSSCAAVCGGERLTYRELNELGNGVADKLRQSGVSPGDTVGLCVSRSIDLIIALVGIVKCGAAYLPFSSSWPGEVLLGMFGDAACTCLLVADPAELKDQFPQLDLIGIDRAGLRRIATNPDVNITGDSIAYVNFTSGTTGRPKGVLIRHRSVARLVLDPLYATLGPETTVLHLSPVTFDAATFEIWGPLLNGGVCALYPGSFLNFPEIRRVVQQAGVTCVFLTTALFNAIVEDAVDTLNGVDTILFGGENYSWRHVERAFKAYGPGRLVHMYGPTECTTFSTYYTIYQMPEASSPLPIGRPIQGTTLFVARDDVLCEPGEIGEILLGGPGVSAGYVGPDPTDAGPFAEVDVAGHRELLYLTGDYGYLLDSGDLVFAGRLDDQVKVNGFRIELSEVSRVLDEHPNVKQSYVTVSDGTAGERLLIAFVVPQDGRSDAAEMRRYLGSLLPDYKVPAAIYECDGLPLLATGKVDRKVLLALHESAVSGTG